MIFLLKSLDDVSQTLKIRYSELKFDNLKTNGKPCTSRS